MRIFLLFLFLFIHGFQINATDQYEQNEQNGFLFEREKFIDYILPEIIKVKSASEEFSNFLNEMNNNKELTEQQYQDICSRMEVFLDEAFSFLRTHSETNESILSSLTNGAYAQIVNFHFYEEFFGVDFVSELINLESRMLIGYTFCSERAVNHIKVVRWTFWGLNKDDDLQSLKRNQRKIESIINGIVSNVEDPSPYQVSLGEKIMLHPQTVFKIDSLYSSF